MNRDNPTERVNRWPSRVGPGLELGLVLALKRGWLRARPWMVGQWEDADRA